MLSSLINKIVFRSSTPTDNTPCVGCTGPFLDQEGVRHREGARHQFHLSCSHHLIQKYLKSDEQKLLCPSCQTELFDKNSLLGKLIVKYPANLQSIFSNVIEIASLSGRLPISVSLVSGAGVGISYNLGILTGDAMFAVNFISIIAFTVFFAGNTLQRHEERNSLPCRSLIYLASGLMNTLAGWGLGMLSAQTGYKVYKEFV